MREKRAERQAAKEAREAAKTAADNGAEPTADGVEAAEAAGAKPKPNGGRSRAPRKKPSPGTARTKRAGSSTKR
jgi:hypothetical protein